jgi:hypothetical protein
MLELQLDFLDLLGLFLLLCLEVEVVDVLRVEGLYPFRDDQGLV